MTETVIVALISAGSSVLVAITALVLNYRGFAAIDSRFASVDARFASLKTGLRTLRTASTAAWRPLRPI